MLRLLWKIGDLIAVEVGDGQTHRLHPLIEPVFVAGIGKGAAMIGPKLATMLGLIVTDAAITPEDAQRLLYQATDLSFNCFVRSK